MTPLEAVDLDGLEQKARAATKHLSGHDLTADGFGLQVWGQSQRGGATHVMDVRGWGYLTGHGHGALGLSDEEGAEAQRAVQAYVVAAWNALPFLIQAARERDGLREAMERAETDLECARKADAQIAALQPNPTQQGGAKWKHPDAVPQVKAGREEYRIVAVRRAHDGQVYRFPATYLNQCVLRFEDDNEERPVTGWFSAVTGEDGEGESYHELLCKGDVLEAWCDLPDAPSDAILAALKTEKA